MSSQAVGANRPSPWILGSVQDLGLLILTPILLLIAAFGLRQFVESRTLQYGVIAFGSLGHNLPGMLRAYGDRALFHRFRVRFVLAPLAFAGASIAFALQGSSGLALIAYGWAIWHALMQAYGFARIYDARLGITSPYAARLDLALTLVWFLGGVVFSDARLFRIQSLVVELGGSPISHDGLLLVRNLVLVVLALVTAAYLWQQVASWRAGRPISWQKNLLHVSSIAFWWYVQVSVADVLLGLVLFEVFHDVQYLTIVWVFNRKRVESGQEVGAFTRFLFRRSWSTIGLYLGLVFAYGGILPATSGLQSSPVWQLILLVFVQTSALLHYYYDGFLWKIRESSTQRALGIESRAGRGDGVVTWHGVKWLFLAVPTAGLLLLGVRPVSLEAAEALAVSTPASAEAQHKLGLQRFAAGRSGDALPALERALSICPGDALVEQDLAMAQLAAGRDLLRAGRLAEAERLILAAGRSRAGLGQFEVEAARQCHQDGDRAAVIVHLQAAALLLPGEAPVHLDLALQLQAEGRLTEALRHARHGAALVPHDARAQALVRELGGGR